MSIKHKNTNTQGPKGPRAIFTSQNLDAPVGTSTLLPEPQLSDLSRPNFSWIYESCQSHTLITLVLHLSTHLSMCQFCASDHATHWKLKYIFDTWLFHRLFGTKLFRIFFAIQSTSARQWLGIYQHVSLVLRQKRHCWQLPELEQDPVLSKKGATTTESSGELKVEVTHFAGASFQVGKHGNTLYQAHRRLQKATTINHLWLYICSILFVLHDSKTPQICTARPPLCGETSIEMLEKNVSSTERRCNVL